VGWLKYTTKEKILNKEREGSLRHGSQHPTEKYRQLHVFAFSLKSWRREKTKIN
jgi:hypothetical protein